VERACAQIIPDAERLFVPGYAGCPDVGWAYAARAPTTLERTSTHA